MSLNIKCLDCRGVSFGSVKDLFNHQKGHRGVKRKQLVPSNVPMVETEAYVETNTELDDSISTPGMDTEMDTEMDIGYDNPRPSYEEFQDYSWVENSDSNKYNFFPQKYVQLQRTLYSETYGEACLDSKTSEEFIEKLAYIKPDHDKSVQFYELIDKMGLTDGQSQEILDFIHSCKIQVEGLYTKWSKISSSYSKRENFMKHNSKPISFPKEWEMNKFKEGNTTITLTYLDPIEQIAYMLVDPDIMLRMEDDIIVNASKMYEFQNEQNRVISNIMTADWAIKTQEMMRFRNPNGILVPFIIYEDGVTVGHLGQVTQTPCLATLGNFDIDLIKTNKSKINLGFLPTLSSFVNIADLTIHLLNLGYSKTQVAKELKFFQMELERSFWKCIYFSITKCWTNGIQLYWLGRGIVTIYTACPFAIGDDPALRSIATLLKNSCISCNFLVHLQEVYNDLKHCKRNAVEIQDLCILAESARKKQSHNLKKLSDKIHLDRAELDALKQLSVLHIHPIINIMNHVPMGAENSIYVGTLDDLHTIMGGIVMNCETWVLRIMNAIQFSSDKEFTNSSHILDSRISNFCKVPIEPHIAWTEFKKGLSYKIATDQAKDKKSSTGKGGGNRTNSSISALIQLYFAIGDYGDILPNAKNYKIRLKAVSKAAKESLKVSEKSTISFNVGNVTETCFIAIKNVLDFYFNSQRLEISVEVDLDKVKETQKMMYNSMVKLWRLKESVILSKDRPFPLSRKLHDSFHLFERILKYGVVKFQSTSPYESYHGTGTVANWNQTSGRKISRDSEMLNYLIHRVFNNACILHRAIYNEQAEFFEKISITEGLSTPRTVVKISIILDTEKGLHLDTYTKTISSSKVDVSSEIWSQVSSNLSFEKYVQFIQDSSYKDEFYSETKSKKLIQKVVVRNKIWGEGIYRVGEFVTINFLDGETNNPWCGVAKILSITEIFTPDGVESDFYFLVHNLVSPAKNKRQELKIKNQYDIHTILTFDKDKKQGIQLFHHENINGPAFVIPCFKNPNLFRYVERAYFDRSGWKELTCVRVEIVEDKDIQQDDNDNFKQLITNYFTVQTPREAVGARLHHDEEDEENEYNNVDDDYSDED